MYRRCRLAAVIEIGFPLLYMLLAMVGAFPQRADIPGVPAPPPPVTPAAPPEPEPAAPPFPLPPFPPPPFPSSTLATDPEGPHAANAAKSGTHHRIDQDFQEQRDIGASRQKGRNEGMLPGGFAVRRAELLKKS